jgi:hypothetical protein
MAPALLIGACLVPGKDAKKVVGRLDRRPDDVNRQHLEDRISGAEGAPAPPGGPPKGDGVIVAKAVGQRLEKPRPASITDTSGRLKEPVEGPRGGERGLVQGRLLVPGERSAPVSHHLPAAAE